jgi:hypothetical protein
LYFIIFLNPFLWKTIKIKAIGCKKNKIIFNYSKNIIYPGGIYQNLILSFLLIIDIDKLKAIEHFLSDLNIP